MKIAYLHGLDSNNLSPKNVWLKSIAELFDPNINYRESNIYQSLKSKIFAFKPDIIIGSSMGGYFAHEIAKELNFTAILFNPALHSRSYEPDMKGHIIGKYNPFMHYVFGQNDNIINPTKTLDVIKNDANKNITYSLLNHGHDTPFEIFQKEIEKYIEKKN
ncbi:YqiA/YcfP family alpha/beta fold hydrolase [Flavobacterium sp. GT3R68]|uniref:YqiA/YcfP family alpha/beta fold hydrolase n=1 Tax=Flavobacterium sp. GT3R68 TaxID=2594437 RepID=UPI000F865EB5|nr:YqiA/YcfP family alpha/beta fold hydrolase [Flavobacterium sp. GT3R68]RTY85481.1 hypothetical protein EKL32_28550 [Flavobacterium sp. GSN2]TRW88715.1 hypothetical protein FNW07_13620 [Flavobacterium sp. GT3R68]